MKKSILLGASLLLLSATPAFTPQAQAEATVYAYNFRSFLGGAVRGLIQMGPDGSNPTELWRDDACYSSTGVAEYLQLTGWLRNGRICGIINAYPYPDHSINRYVERDLTSGEIILEENINAPEGDWTSFFQSAAYVPVSDCIYGFGFNAERTAFAFKKAPADDISQAQIISDVNTQDLCYSLCYNAEEGTIMGINLAHELVRIDPATGKSTYIMTINADYDYKSPSGLAWIADKGAYITDHYNIGDNGYTQLSELLSLNPESGSTSVARTFANLYEFGWFVTVDNAPAVAAKGPELSLIHISEPTRPY